MYDMLTGSPPFCADSRRETTRMVLHGRISLPHHLSAEAKDLLKNLLKRNSVSRLGADPDDSKEVQVFLSSFKSLQFHFRDTAGSEISTGLNYLIKNFQCLIFPKLQV